MAKPSKISHFFKNLLTVLLIIVIICTLGLNLLFQNDNSAPFIFGNGFYVMRQINMTDVNYGDVVISNKNKISEIQPGNVVLCLTSYDDFKEVLRVQDIVQEDGNTYYMVRSDDVNDQPRKLSSDKILAKCTYTNSILGKIIEFSKSLLGIAILVGGSGIILVVMYLASYSAKYQEKLREEEERKANQIKRNQKRPNNDGENRPHNNENNPNRAKNPNGNPNRRPRPNNDTTIGANEGVRNRQKPIQVTQLSEEESIKQRENISNMVGSELNNDSQGKEITREFNSADVVVSQPSNFEAIKIHEREQKPKKYPDSVHSPNMERKAVEIKKALSQTDVDDNEVKPMTSKVQEPQVKPIEPPIQKNVEPIPPIEPIKPLDEPKPVENAKSEVVEPVKPVVSQPKKEEPISDTIVVIPTSLEKDNQPKVENPIETVKKEKPKPSKPTSKPTRPKSTNIDKLLNEDNFIDNLFNDETPKSNSVKVSDDVLDELLNSIPSTRPVEDTPVKPIKPEVKKPVHKSTTHKKSTKTTTTTTHRPSNTKKVDSTSFDELLKAIEKEKNNIK
ncbi:MAG: hypothetical protein ACI4WH_04130 [Oscillospiraceae bacterium]